MGNLSAGITHEVIWCWDGMLLVGKDLLADYYSPYLILESFLLFSSFIGKRPGFGN